MLVCTTTQSCGPVKFHYDWNTLLSTGCACRPKCTDPALSRNLGMSLCCGSRRRSKPRTFLVWRTIDNKEILTILVGAPILAESNQLGITSFVYGTKCSNKSRFFDNSILFERDRQGVGVARCSSACTASTNLEISGNILTPAGRTRASDSLARHTSSGRASERPIPRQSRANGL